MAQDQTTRPNTNPTPKARFQSEVGNVTAHRSMMELPAFARGIDAALLEYQKLLSEQVVDGNTGMSAGFRAQGALEVMSVLKTLSETTQRPTPRRDIDNLPQVEKMPGKIITS